ncbi:hypothetical protein ACLX1H_010850 [Fusarium chlamydosporum]
MSEQDPEDVLPFSTPAGSEATVQTDVTPDDALLRGAKVWFQELRKVLDDLMVIYANDLVRAPDPNGDRPRKIEELKKDKERIIDNLLSMASVQLKIDEKDCHTWPEFGEEIIMRGIRRHMNQHERR